MSPGDSTVLFRALPTNSKLAEQDQQVIADFAAVLSKVVAKNRPFHCLITGNRTLRKLNSQFLGHDYPTDVLSFPAGESDFLGDVAISIQIAETQAGAYGHSRTDELRVLMLHGLLHLLGYDHETDNGRMARAERKWRLHFGLPCNLIARAQGKVAS